MTEQWKPIGDKWPQPAMVWVQGSKTGGSGFVRITDKDGYLCGETVHQRTLYPMPPIITPEQQAVLDAAEVWLSAGWTDRRDHALTDAIRAMLAAQQPPDPVKELRDAWTAYQRAPHVPDRISRMEAAIAALGAKS